jgi:hypothetical protein
MDEHLRDLEERLARAEKILEALGGYLAISPSGGVAIRGPVQVTDNSGTPVLEVEAGEYGPAVRLLNASGERVMILDSIATGGSISVCHRSGKPVVLLFADEAGGDLTVYDRDGEVQYSSP